MKGVFRLTGIFFVCIATLAMTSCGSKVDQETLNKKIEAAQKSDKAPEFTDAEYEFMAEYVYDNRDKLDDENTPEEISINCLTYGFILLGAQMEGKLPPKAVKIYKKISEKSSSNLQQNEEAVRKALEEADIDLESLKEEIVTED